MVTMQEAGQNSVKKLVFLDNGAPEATWKVIYDHLEKHGELFTEHYSPEGAKKLVKEGLMDLWIGGFTSNESFNIEIYAFTSILNYDKKRVFMIWFVGGKNLKDYISVIEFFRGYASEKNCTALECNARPGVERALTKVGFYEKMVHLSMPIRRKEELN